jgi:hypothetical protein
MSTEQESKGSEGEVESPMAQKLKAGLPPLHILVVAAKNAKNHFFIPSKINDFARIRYEFVMIDNGCNSLLFPFKDVVLLMFRGNEFK